MAPSKAQCKLIGYRRVSTRKQEASGLGLDAQQAAIDAHVKATGCALVASYTEIESGKRCDRPELAKALAHAKRAGATLVIAKLDRLSRNVAFLANLMESKVPFVACDNPHATPFTIHILAAVAEKEAKDTSDRTKAALKAYRDGGRVSKRIMSLYPDGVPQDVVKATAGKLGSRLVGCHLDDEAKARGRAMGNLKQSAAAVEVYKDLIPDMKAWRAEGATLQAIADRLNAAEHTTRTGAKWNTTQVMRCLKRAGS